MLCKQICKRRFNLWFRRVGKRNGCPCFLAGRDRLTDRSVIIKLPQVGREDDIRKEIRAFQKLKGVEGFAKLIDGDDATASPWAVFEPAQGLKFEFVETLSVNQKKAILLSILGATVRAWQKGIMINDFKPDVFWDGKQVTIVDLNGAIILEQKSLENETRRNAAEIKELVNFCSMMVINFFGGRVEEKTMREKTGVFRYGKMIRSAGMPSDLQSWAEALLNNEYKDSMKAFGDLREALKG